MEPEGDSPYRKSIYDSLAFGCIPVLFSRAMQLVAPFMWSDAWKADSHVFSNWTLDTNLHYLHFDAPSS